MLKLALIATTALWAGTALADEVIIHRDAPEVVVAPPPAASSTTTVETHDTPDGCQSKTVHKENDEGDSKTVHTTNCD